MSAALDAPSGLWLTAPDTGRRWWFDPGSLALTFGYSGDFSHGVEEWESLRSPGDLDEWFAEHLEAPSAPTSADDLAAALELRAAIVACTIRLASGSSMRSGDVDAINARAALGAVAPRLAGGRAAPTSPTATRLLGTVAHDAIRVFSLPADRIRQCGADDCWLHFVDTSRPGARRWCSMQRCGGRAKQRAHYSRHTEGGTS